MKWIQHERNNESKMRRCWWLWRQNANSQKQKLQIRNEKKRNMKNDKPAYYYYKHNCSSFLGSSSRKFLTYVTKTRPNLATYSRKLGNYNGTIIFEVDIIPNQFKYLSNLTFTPMFWLFSLFWFTLKLSWECCEFSRKEVTSLFWQWQKCEF